MLFICDFTLVNIKIVMSLYEVNAYYSKLFYYCAKNEKKMDCKSNQN
jgi:hypothetical protein